MMCIYLRTNLVNGKQYVGQTVNFKRRENDWENRKKYSNGIIDKARAKYGTENFKVEILRECQTLEELDKWEKYYIKELNTKTPNGYNMNDGGIGNAGLKMSEEIKKLMSKLRRGKKRPEFAEKMKGEKNPFFHKTHSKETIEKIKAANKGKTAYNKGKTYEEQFGEEKAKELKQKCINNAYRVDQIDKVTGEVLHQWDCSKDAARELGLEYTNINKCAKGRYKTAFGYIWKRVA